MTKTCDYCRRPILPGHVYFAGPVVEHDICRLLREKEKERVQDCVKLRERAEQAEAALAAETDAHAIRTRLWNDEGLRAEQAEQDRDEARAALAKAQEDIDDYKTCEDDEREMRERVKRATDVELRRILGPCWNHLWGSPLEDLGGLLDAAKRAAEAAEARVAELEQVLAEEQHHARRVLDAVPRLAVLERIAEAAEAVVEAETERRSGHAFKSARIEQERVVALRVDVLRAALAARGKETP